MAETIIQSPRNKFLRGEKMAKRQITRDALSELDWAGDGRRNGMKRLNEEKIARGLGWFSIGLGLAEIAAPRSLAKLIGVRGDAIDLALLGAAFRLKRSNRNKLAMATAAVAGVTALDAICSQRLSRRNGARGNGVIHVAQSVTINRSPEELYRFWRDFQNLPRFMKHLESVRATGDRSSHWAAKAPAGRTVEWD